MSPFAKSRLGSWSNLIVGCLLAAVPAHAQPPSGGASGEPIRRQIQRYRQREPSVGEVVAAALRAALPPDRIDELSSQAALSGLLPTLRLGARRGRGQDLSAWEGAIDDRRNVSTDDQLSLEVSLTFDLDRLLYHPDDLSFGREQRADEERRHQLVRTVVGIYFQRRRLMLRRDLLGERGIETHTQIAELSALLDAFTDGAFRRMIAHRNRGRGP